MRNQAAVAGEGPGVPETFAPELRDANESRRASGLDEEAIERLISERTALRRAPRLPQLADAAAFLASVRAAAMILDVTCGMVI